MQADEVRTVTARRWTHDRLPVFEASDDVRPVHLMESRTIVAHSDHLLVAGRKRMGEGRRQAFAERGSLLQRLRRVDHREAAVGQHRARVTVERSYDLRAPGPVVPEEALVLPLTMRIVAEEQDGGMRRRSADTSGGVESARSRRQESVRARVDAPGSADPMRRGRTHLHAHAAQRRPRHHTPSATDVAPGVQRTVDREANPLHRPPRFRLPVGRWQTSPRRRHRGPVHRRPVLLRKKHRCGHKGKPSWCSSTAQLRLETHLFGRHNPGATIPARQPRCLQTGTDVEGARVTGSRPREAVFLAARLPGDPHDERGSLARLALGVELSMVPVHQLL